MKTVMECEGEKELKAWYNEQMARANAEHDRIVETVEFLGNHYGIDKDRLDIPAEIDEEEWEKDRDRLDVLVEMADEVWEQDVQYADREFGQRMGEFNVAEGD